jgi:hypothetical protein
MNNMNFDDIEIGLDPEEEMYDFVFHFMPWFVCNLKPERKSLLDDTNYLEINCPDDFKFQLHKITIGSINCRILTFDKPVFADMEVPMCMTVTSMDDTELLGYFTLEKNDLLGYVACKVDTEEHSLLNHIKWAELPSIEDFAVKVTEKLKKE